jgi:hypothetical protein
MCKTWSKQGTIYRKHGNGWINHRRRMGEKDTEAAGDSLGGGSEKKNEAKKQRTGRDTMKEHGVGVHTTLRKSMDSK